MRLSPSHSSHILHLINGSSQILFRRGLRRGVVCFALMINLLIWPGSGFALRQLSAFASTITITGAPIYNLSFWLRELFRTSTARRHDTLADRLAAVAYISISPVKFVGYVDETVTFTASPTDSLNRIIQGVKFSWSTSDPDKLQVDDAGRAKFLQPGLALVVCRGGTIEASAPVLIKPDHRPTQSDAQWRADQAALGFNGIPVTGSSSTGGTANIDSSLLDKLVPTAHAQSYSWNAYYGTDTLFDELWSDPANLVGSPRNSAIEPTRLGNVLPEGSNFNLAIPLISVAGRGLPLNLSLYYNSRVWFKQGNNIVFDAIASWPTPGFSLGFGRMVSYSGGGKFIYVAPDGTRHYLEPLSGHYKAKDGSQITYYPYYSDGSGSLYFADGTEVAISNVNNRLLPTSIIDRNGNHIQIAYKPDAVQQGNETYFGIYPAMAIDYIIDTLGRRYEFQYDTGGRLTSITAPGYGGTVQNPATRTICRFGYESTQPGANLRTVYFPATNTGWVFSYSQLRMIYNYSFRRDMGFNVWPNSPVGIQDGVETASLLLNYPVSGTTPPSVVPSFDQRNEAAVNSPLAIYTYTREPENTTEHSKMFRIQRPDTTIMELTRSTDSTSVANGLLIRSELKNGSSSLGKTEFTYTDEGSGSPQVKSIISYDDSATPLQTKVDFDYDQYDNVTNKREYGFKVNNQWQVKRRTHYTYHSALTHSVTLRELFDATGGTEQLIAKSLYVYDNYVSMGGVENYGGPSPPPPGHINRGPGGNVTGEEQWYDLSANPIQHRRKYDIFGNVVRAEVSCCEMKDLTNTDATYWSQPEEEVSDPGGLNLTTRAHYDFNTSLADTRTTPGDQTTNYGYNAALMPASADLPTGVTVQSGMNYGALSSSSTVTYDDGLVTKTVTSTTQYDGWGRVIQAINENNAQVNTSYDAMGRVQSRTNPFQVGQQPGPATTYEYDLLGRLKKASLPDGNTVQAAYSGSSVTSTDQVGRKIKKESDGLGRLVKVTEQDSVGALTQETTYSYNMLDKLTLVNQGGQTRSYKYDALGRLLCERIPEQSGTISDGSGGMWSTKYSYTEWGAISIRTDVRGVESHYRYDTLHRLIEQWYTGLGGDVEGNTRPALPSGVSATNNVAYSYDTSSTSTTSGLLMSVTMSGPLATYTESFGYDAYRRLISRTWTRDNLSFAIGYGYNEAGQRTSLIYPSGRVVKTNYGSTGRFSSLVNQADNTNFVSNLSYNVAGQVTGLSLGNGVTESYYYDSQRMQLTAQQATAPGGATAGLMNVGYTYNASAGDNGAGTTAGNTGQMKSVYGQIGGIGEGATYTYDLQGRLATSYTGTNNQAAYRRYAYDRWGNRTGMWDALNGGNQIQSISLQQSGGAPTNQIQSVSASGVTKNYQYDAAGNVINDGTHAYDYDAENRNKGVDGGATAAVAFDYQNQRIKKVAGGVITYYVWEGSQVIAEYNASGGLLAEYIYSGSRMAAKISGGVTRYYLNDRLSARAVLDSSGNVVGRQGHLPYGEDFGGSNEQEKHHFTSYERDSESGLDYAINRTYSVLLGSFTSVDPYKGSGRIADPQSLNRYGYTGNDPINRTDSLGLYAAPPINPPPSNWGCLPGTHYDSVLGGCIRDGFSVDPYRPQPPGVTSGWMQLPQPVNVSVDIWEWLKNLAPPGRVSVDSACGNSVLYVREDNKESKPEKAWRDAAQLHGEAVDFIATARGVIKIPGTCNCSVSCSNNDDYKITCTCMLGLAPTTVGDRDFNSGMVADPRTVDAWKWVGERDPYRFNVIFANENGGIYEYK